MEIFSKQKNSLIYYIKKNDVETIIKLLSSQKFTNKIISQNVYYSTYYNNKYLVNLFMTLANCDDFYIGVSVARALKKKNFDIALLLLNQNTSINFKKIFSYFCENGDKEVVSFLIKYFNHQFADENCDGIFKHVKNKIQFFYESKHPKGATNINENKNKIAEDAFNNCFFKDFNSFLKIVNNVKVEYLDVIKRNKILSLLDENDFQKEKNEKINNFDAYLNENYKKFKFLLRDLRFKIEKFEIEDVEIILNLKKKNSKQIFEILNLINNFKQIIIYLLIYF
jgi:hypothetical protein